jgi:glycogen debranching enzyme
MRWLLVLTLLTGMAHAKSVGCLHKGVESLPPTLPSSAPQDWQSAFDDTHRLLCKNLKTPNTFFRGYRARPAKPFRAAYLWDTAFITQIWRHWDTRIAQELLDYVFRHQKPSGLIHHAIAEIIVKPLPQRATQPPLLSWATWRVFEKSKDHRWLESAYPKLKKYQDWLRLERRHPDGLYFWHDPYESGIDNSPRFANRDESFFDDTRRMAAVDMSSYIVLSLEALENIAKELGLNDEARAYQQERETLKATINSRLWDTVSGSYHDWDYRKQDFIRIHTVSDLTPLVAGIPNEAQAALIAARIMDPVKYNTLIPFPSVARDEAIFVKDMWRGPVWINMAYLGILGMQRYGYSNEARELSHRLASGVYATWEAEGSIFEFYDPDRTDISELHRKKGNWWKKLTLGSKPVKEFVGWSGLVNALLQEFP